ncbi:MAG TPA: CCA tRNA nucleotidyltransferase [Candidatus Binatia bacterium]
MTRREKAVAIIERLKQAGFEAYFAGGSVRDMLLGRDPDDYDIATAARPEDIRKIFPRTLEVGAQFGIILVLSDGDAFEVATFRYDGPYLDGRRPSEVRYAGLEEDIRRRDFTVNGLMYDPLEDRLIDLVGGRDDLSRRRIRAIGDAHARFQEDRLRMIRAARFSASLGFEIERDTLDAIRAEAAHITQVSWERIGEEITRILTEGGARRGFEIMDATGLLPHILPEIAAMHGVEQSPDYHPEGDVFVHTMLVLEKLAEPAETVAYGALLHDVAKPVTAGRNEQRITFYGHTEQGAEMAVAILKRLKRSRSVWERVAYIVKSHLRPVQAPKMRVSTLKRFLGEPGIHELLEVVRLDALASNGDLQYYDFCRQRMAELKHEEIHPPPLVTGKDLIALGLEPGPMFHEILDRIKEAQLEGELRDRQAALEWVKREYGRRH